VSDRATDNLNLLTIMNRNALLTLLLTATMVFRGFAADAPSKQFWYRFVVMAGDQRETFNGSSAIEPDQVLARLKADETIPLENLRNHVYHPNEEPKTRWVSAGDGSKIYLRAHTVLYFYTLPRDPLTENK
jgi:hypothetical protein